MIMEPLLYFCNFSVVPFSRNDYWLIAKKLGWGRVSSAFIGKRKGMEIIGEEMELTDWILYGRLVYYRM